jgi:hypothetical protein
VLEHAQHAEAQEVRPTLLHSAVLSQLLIGAVHITFMSPRAIVFAGILVDFRYDEMEPGY